MLTKRLLATGLAASAFAMGGISAPPSRAACLNSECSEFDPATVSNVNYSGFTGAGTTPFGWDRARVRFTLNGASFGFPITISNIRLTGDLITTDLNFDDVVLTSNSSFNSIFLDLTAPGNTFDYANTTLEYDIPASGSFVIDQSTLEVLVQYRYDDELDQISSETNLISTARVPDPLAFGAFIPLFSFSRKLRSLTMNK